MIKYRKGYEIDYIRLIEMFIEAGWEDKTSDFKRLESMVKNSDLVITAWDFDYMIGFARMTYDEAFIGRIYNVVVDSEYRGTDIEKELINHMITHDSRIKYIGNF